MIMMLPFLTALLGVLFALQGYRRTGFVLWLVTLAIFIAWSMAHMTSTLPISI
ncbi:MAG: hypothetical protein GX049_01140 [Alcaligenaceae bacterium]|nr:hypothetical protein [Alcaligenaceae bacterium]